MTRNIIEGGHIATVDAAGSEFAAGHVVVEDGVIAAVGAGRAGDEWRDGAEVVNAAGCLVTPGLVNTHHHLYQWLTRGWAVDASLFGWLRTLYPVWARITPEDVEAAALIALGELALSGCTTAADHHYLVPNGDDSVFDAIAAAARTIGVRVHLARGSMDLGTSQGGLPPDFACETTDQALRASADAVDRHHDASFGAMVQVSVAPCSPFSVTTASTVRWIAPIRSLRPLAASRPVSSRGSAVQTVPSLSTQVSAST